ncbi:MAG TPA: hypothetical protein VKT31_08795 [Solirubrobacteraceae bacterium]|nr:hypothetical protein [Solirubrobacteraceae bacterium]
MSARLKVVLPMALSIGLIAFLYSEFTLNFNLHWYTVTDGVFGKFGLPEKFQFVLPASFVTWGLYFMLGANRAAFRKTLIACTTGTIGAVVIMTLGPSLAGLPHFWGLALAIAIVGAGLELLSALTDDGSFNAAPAFACAAAVLLWWFVTGLDNYVPNGKGTHTVAGLVLALTKHPLAAGTGAVGGLFSTPWTYVALSGWISLLVGPALGLVARVLAAPGRVLGPSPAAVEPGVAA